MFVGNPRHMILSMTGFGKTLVDLPGFKITVEIRTLNSRLFDLSLKIPAFLRDKEAEIRSILAHQIERGKTDLMITYESTGGSSDYVINHSLAHKYQTELKILLQELREDCPTGLLPLIMQMPDILQAGNQEITETVWQSISGAIQETLKQVEDFRRKEGNILEEEIRHRIGLIQNLLNSITPFEEQRILSLREKMLQDFTKWIQADFNGAAPDRNRFEQELIYYLEKLDITEEKVRLGKHCDYFMETLIEPVSQGKKLGFIVQEMGREINTIGSKASDATIQKIVVQMKDELEKIKEQLGNIL